MVEPLALVLYEKLLPGTQVVSRLQELQYRVQTLNDADKLVSCAEESKPMLVLTDLRSTRHNVAEAIARLRNHPATSHLPVIAFGGDAASSATPAAKPEGVTLMVSDAALLSHLSECLDRALEVE